MDPSSTAPPELLELKKECDARGFMSVSDYRIVGVTSGSAGDTMVFGIHDGKYVVAYDEKGSLRTLFTSSSFEDAKRRFLEDLAGTAWGHGWRTPDGREPPGRYDGMTPRQVFEEMQKEGYFPGEAWPEED